MKEFVSETVSEASNKLMRAEHMINDEGSKLFDEHGIKYKFDHYCGEIRLMFVKQTDFSGGKLAHSHLSPLVERLREIDEKWSAGIMLYGARRVKNETKIS